MAPARILVVDDEAPITRLLQRWLSREGYAVDRAHSFDEVRTRLAAGDCDLVTLDIAMPGVDGLAILRWLRTQYPDVGVVMATALGNLDTVLEAMRGGALDYLLKPFNLELVSQEISRALEHQRLVRENRAYQRGLEEKVKERTRALRDAYMRLEQKVRELEARDRLVHFQMESHTRQEAYAEILEMLTQVLEAPKAVIYQFDEKSARLQAVAGVGWSGPGRVESRKTLEALPELPSDPENGLEARAILERKPQWRDGCAAVPILYRESPMGVLAVEKLEEDRKEDLLNALWRLSGEAALVLQGIAMAEELEAEIPSLEKLEELE